MEIHILIKLSKIDEIGMNKKFVVKIGSILLIIHGIIEILAIMMLFIPSGFIPASLQEQSEFWAILSVIYGTSRLIAGLQILKLKKWGIILGITLSLTTMIVAPTIFPFGIMDLPIAIIVMICLLYIWFGSEKIEI